MQPKCHRFKCSHKSWWTNKQIDNESGPSYEMNRINKARLNVCKKGKSESSIPLLLKPLMSVWLNEHYKLKLYETIWGFWCVSTLLMSLPPQRTKGNRVPPHSHISRITHISAIPENTCAVTQQEGWSNFNPGPCCQIWCVCVCVCVCVHRKKSACCCMTHATQYIPLITE